MKSNIFFRSLLSISDYLNKKQKKKALLLISALLFTSLLDVVGLAAIIPVIQIASKPESIQSNSYLAGIYHGLNFESTNSFLFFLICGVFAFFIVKNLVILFINYRQIKFIASITLRVIDDQFSKYYKLKFWKFNDLGASRIINYVNQSPNLYCNHLLNPLFLLLAEVFVVVFIIVGIALYQPILFLILTIVLGPTTFLIYGALKNKTQKVGNEMDALRPETYSLIYDAFAGYVDIKLTNKQETFQKRFLANKKKYFDLNALSSLYKILPPKVIETIAILGVVLIFIYSIFFSNETSSILTLLGLFVAAAYRLMPSVNRILSSLMSLKQHQFTIENLELYRDNTYKEKINEKQTPLTFDRDIVIKDMSFSFPDSETPTLKNIDFAVQRGEKIGFVGTSGSGKTTLMNILLRFYEEDKGSILVDGNPIGSHNLISWRNKIGYVRQDVFLMEGNIRDNITLNEDEVDEEQLQRAVKQSSLSNFVDSLPDGLDTYVGEKGSKLSGGQKQRVGIARALYHKAEVLFFDEATSALDNETEREVTEAIGRLSNTNITLFIVAHRITTLKDCDRIYELENGRIVGEHQYTDIISEVI